MSKPLTCAYCSHPVEAGIIKDGKAYCNEKEARRHYENSRDSIAWDKGYISYEDMIEHEYPNALVYHPDIPRREY